MQLSSDSEIALRSRCEDFYYHEAELLDAGRLKEWLDLLSEDIEYEIPTRVTKERSSGSLGFSSESYFLREDRKSLEARIKRFESEYAWSEEIPSRTRHFVSNVRIKTDGNVGGNLLYVKSNVLVYRSQGNAVSYSIVSAERNDTLIHTDGIGFRIKKRTVLLDHTILPMPNFSIFI